MTRPKLLSRTDRRDGSRHTSRTRRARSRAAFTLVEVIVALAILSGVLLGLSDYTRRLTAATTRAASVTAASDAASEQLEAIKAWREYSSLVATYHGTTTTFATGAWAGLTRDTFAVRTGPSATADHVTVTVVVSGRDLPTPVRKSTVIAGF
jgi:prepilin-type N-terminal cleavage/methylation domain-containing protein